MPLSHNYWCWNCKKMYSDSCPIHSRTDCPCWSGGIFVLAKDCEQHQTVLPQPPPTHNDKPAVWDLVISDMHARDEFGRNKYKVRLQPHNGRDALMDLYQEQLDACAYTRQLIFERDGN